MHTNQKTNFFDFFSIPVFFTGWALLSFLLTWTHLFYPFFFILYACIWTIIVWKKYQKQIIKIENKKNFFFLLLSATISCCLAYFFHTSSLFTGRDQGSIAQASIILSQQHTLVSTSPEANVFFKIYGQGTALNFPGFAYTEHGQLTTQFPIASIAWYASFYSIFGISGFSIANAILVFLFLWSLFLISKKFLDTGMSLFLILLSATTFPIFWFSRFTLSENFVLGFLWVTLTATVHLFQNKKPVHLWIALLAGSLLPFARIEGIILFGILLFLLLKREETRSIILQNTRPFLIYSTVFIPFFLWNMFVTLPFYKNIIKALLQSDITNIPTSANPTHIFSKITSVFSVFFNYGLLEILILGIVSIVIFAWKKRDDFPLFIPILITGPVFLYLVHSFISGDHPWMLRRFAFAVIPVMIWYSIVFLQNILRQPGILRKITASSLMLFLFISNISACIYFFPFSEGSDLLTQTRSLSEKFGNNDLVLIDRLATSDPWLLLSGPMSSLFGKHAVYFFNPNNWRDMDVSAFDKIYLVVSETNASFYTTSSLYPFLHFEDIFTLSFEHLQPETNPFEIPQKQHVTQKLLIYSLHP